jgi:tetratricopeptide (TPR) repeat protein
MMRSFVIAAFWSLSLWGQPATLDVPGLSRSAIDKAPLGPLEKQDLQDALDRREYPAAEALLGKSFAQNPQSPELLKLIAGVSFLEGKYLNAAIALKKAEKIAPLDWHSRFTLALAYVVLKRPQWARTELEKLSAEFPRNPVYVYWQGRLDYDAQLFPAAVEKFRKVLELQPDYMRAYNNLGLCYEAIGHMDDAVSTYAEAMRLNRTLPAKSPWPPLNAGTLLLKLGRLDEAEAALRESLSYDARFPQALYQLGVVFEKKDEPAKAIGYLRNASELDPNYPEPLYALGRVYRRLGQTDKATEVLQRFQALHAAKSDGR